MKTDAIIPISLGKLMFELHISPERGLRTRHNWVATRHNNKDHELHLIISGTCRVEVEDVVYDLHAGQGILILSGKYHRPIAHSPDFDRLLLGFLPHRGSFVPDGDTTCVVLNFSPSTIALARELMDEYTLPGAFHQELAHSILNHLTIRLLRGLDITDTRAASAVGVDLRVDVIDNFFAGCFAENVTQADLAAQMHLSSRQVNRFLQKRYGMGFREKLINTRMQHAGWLLRNTEYTVQQIAPQVGYASVSSFIHSFSRFYGKSPQQFRKQPGKEI